jgi:hypothetical protein
MPDWKELVRERMASLALPRESQEDIVAELAAHLEETYEAARARNLSCGDAVKVAFEEVGGWGSLAKNVCRAKSEEERMNERTKSLWLPAMVNLFAAMGLLMLMQRMGVEPRLVWVDAAEGKFAMVFYYPWLMVLPLFGAAGAYLARRAQGEVLTVLAAGLSPALTLIGLICLIAPWGLLVDGVSVFRLVLIGTGLLTWGMLPGAALLVGALPFLRKPLRNPNLAGS